MADSVEGFREVTQVLLQELHQEVNHTAWIVAQSAEGISDQEKGKRFSQLRIDLLAGVFAALMTEHTSVPILELRYVPAWARGSSLEAETVEANTPTP